MKAKKLLALLLSMLLMVSSMAMGVLPVSAEDTAETTIPVARMSYYASAANQYYGVTVAGLTADSDYTLTALFKAESGSAGVSFDGVKLVSAATAENGAAYNADTGLLVYNFTAADADVRINLELFGNSTETGVLGAVTVADSTGNVVYSTAGTYTDGTLTALEGWSDGWGSNAYISFTEVPYSFFGATDPATCEHVYNNDCDVMCDTCGTFRVSVGHAYDDKNDTDCNNCGEIRFVPTYLPTGSLHFYAPFSFSATGTVSGLTVNNVYTLTMFFKNTVRTGKVTVGGVEIVNGTTAMNGATYDATTSLLTYSFAAPNSSIKVVVDLIDNQTTVDFGGLTVADSLGNVVYSTTGTYDESGTLTGLSDWGGSWANTSYLSYAEQLYSFFGATDPKLCETHTYTNDCDMFCNACGSGRTVTGHVYDDDLDAYCNLCNELRAPAVPTLMGAEMSYHAYYSDQAYGVTVTDLIVGNQYTLSAYVNGTGSGALTFNGAALVTATTPAEGVTYDTTTSLMTYTFTATDSDEDGIGDATIKMELLGSTSELVRFADMKITDAEGAVVYTPAPAYNSSGSWVGFEGWQTVESTSTGPKYVTTKNYTYDFFNLTAPCMHRYAGPCTAACAYCGETREVDADAHVYDDENDGDCNNCFKVREGFVNVTTGYEYVSGDTLGWTSSVSGLTVGANYTLSFLWKSEGTPYFYINDLDTRILEGMIPANGATIDYETGRVTYNFAAIATEVGFGMVMNTATSGYSKFWIADVSITDADGNVVYQNDTTTDTDRGWGWVGWSNRWGNQQRTYTFPNLNLEFFACSHAYDNTCDTDCNYCGEMRLIEHTFTNDCDAACDVCGETRTVAGHAYDNDCDADCNSCGETREVAGHAYDNDCDVDCNVCGETREVADHVYDDDADTTCNVCGAVREIATHVPGDIDGNGVVNVRDQVFLQRYLNDWDVEVDENALDVTGDGVVNVKDQVFLQRYLNDWDVTIY